MVGQKLSDRYEIVSELGRGGMGVVYKAQDPVLNREVAIKLISPALLTPEIEQRFQIEAQVVAQMDHPSIVSIYDFGHHEGSLFFVMPVLEGTGLHELIRDQSLRLGEILDIGIDVAEALSYSHDRGVIHRDIKPENIMVSRDAEGGHLRVRVMDFGLARRTKVTALTKTGMLIGTASYVSPEQVTGTIVDGRADLYSLGTVLYNCLANDVPFTGELQSVLYRIVHEVPQSPRALGADIDDELEGIILSCLSKEPEHRPQSAKELMQTLVGYRSRLHESQRMKSVTVSRAVQVKRPLSPFINRTSELKELQQRLNLAVGGECQFVVLSGEPGIGKTRLLDELESLAKARHIRVLHGRFMEQDAAFPYHGFCEIIQEFFRRKETGSSPTEIPDFSDLGADLVGLFPMLGEIDAIRSTSSGAARPTQKPRHRSPENRHQIFELLARTLTRLAGGRPLVLLIEDLHGAEVSIEALQYIVRRLGPTSTLIVASYRSTEVDRRHPLTQMLESFQGDRRFASIALGPLAQSDHHSLLTTLVGGSEIVDGLAAKLYEASEGNPFFTKELLRSLLDAGNVIQNDRGAWTLSGETEISSEALPETIQQAVEKRMERLPDEMRKVLSIASVMGKTFDFRDLETLAHAHGDLDEAVDTLVKEGLIEEERRSRGDRLTFSSGVVREVLYAELSRRKRRSLHRKYAEELEKRHGGRLERVYPQLVYHFSEGDVPEKTVEYGLLQAKKSLEAFGPDEAIRSARTALEFLDEEWEGDRAIEAEARMLLAAGNEMAGEVNAALRDLQTAITIFEREGQAERVVDALLAAAQVAWKARRTEETKRWVERGLAAAKEAGVAEVQGEFLSLAATLANLRGEYARASEYLKEAELLAPRPDDKTKVEEIPRGGKLVVALASPVTAAEPAAIRLIEEAEVYTNVFETLMATDEDGNLAPSLAENCEAREGGRSFVFALRSGVRFQDGEELTADAVKQSFERSIREVTPNQTPAFAAIRGFAAFAAGTADRLDGLQVHSEKRLEIHLEEPLPIYPALLTDARSGITRRPSSTDPATLLGTGPFRLVSRDKDRLILERNPTYWKTDPPNLDAIEFRPGLTSSAIASGLRSGEFDLARDLQPWELEEIQRDPRFRGRLVEVPQKTTYFVLFNSRSGPNAKEKVLRQALSGVIRTRDLVWTTLGRFAQPATGYLPPGILGHDPGRRPRHIPREKAQEMLRSAGLPERILLEAAVHPILQDRCKSLLEALVPVWGDLGVELSIETPDMESFLEAWEKNEGIDLIINRWIPDYADPDNLTHTLFHSGAGLLKNYCASPECDQILESARAERRPTMREDFYRRFQKLFLDSGILIPLFHDVDYRVASPKVRGIKLSSIAPHVNYRELGKAESTVAEPIHQDRGGTIRVPMTGQVHSLDPALSTSSEQDEVLPSIYETLTRDVGEAQIVPWLASEFTSEDRGKRYRFRLRDDVYFHDGRKLTARDVRHSFERLLQSEDSHSRWQYAPIVGAKALLNGEASELAGLEIQSASEFTVDLEKPVSFFPGLISFSAAAIVPEGTGRIGKNWRDGAVGTGPFRVSRFSPGRRLELERNASYWRKGFPRSQGLAFIYGVSPKEILSGFRAGRFSLASDLFPADVEALRREARFASGYRETPRLSTYYVAFNTRRGPMSDTSLRKKLVQALSVAPLVQQTLGQVAIPAHGLIPPGLLGYEPYRAADNPPPLSRASSVDVELSAAVHPVFTREYAAFFDKITEALGKIGIRIKPSKESMGDLLEAKKQTDVDLALVQWVADYPDADTFVQILQTDAGFVGPLCGCSEVDRLIDRGRAETDPDSRHAIYRQVEEVLTQEARLLPLFHEQVYRFARPEVEGLAISYWSPAVAYEKLRVRET